MGLGGHGDRGAAAGGTGEPVLHLALVALPALLCVLCLCIVECNCQCSPAPTCNLLQFAFVKEKAVDGKRSLACCRLVQIRLT